MKHISMIASIAGLSRAYCTLALLFAACLPAENDLDSGTPSPTSKFDDSARRESVVLASADADTVWQWVDGDVGTIVWTNAGAERWRSDYAYRTEPHVDLGYIDRDSSPDLFWSIAEKDGPMGGMVLLARGEDARIAFTSPTDACLPPVLTDVNRDRMPDVVHYAPGLIDAERCRTFSYTGCAERYATDWRQAYVQLDGRFVADESQAPAYYRQTSMLYLHSAGRLRRHLATLSDDSLTVHVCDSAMAAGLVKLSERAARASGRTGPY